MSDSISPPEGFVTFVFTDIEDSTKMCRALRDDVYAREMREPHCQRIRQLIEEHRGYENGTAGDSFMIVFQHADDALACVAGIQKALAEPAITRRDCKGTDWTIRVRIGVHTAETQFRPNERGDYIGDDVNYAARVQSLGRGGQIIVSDAAHRAAGSASRHAWQGWPNRRLKSIDKPEVVHELLWRGPGTSLGDPGSRWIPDWFKGEQNRYVPRDALEDEILATFAEADLSRPPPRLVTLHATGGMGKTRLAIACAVKAVGFFEGEVFFVALDDAPEPGTDWVVERLARALGLSGPAASQDGVVRYLQDKLCLIVLDNYETVDCDPVAAFIGRLLRGTTGLRLLVTGREAVRLDDIERPIRLDDGLSLDEARELFIERATLLKPRGWQLAPDELTIILRIVMELECVPLSIELAAAWTGRKSNREIYLELKQALLGPITAIPPRGRRADPTPRHHSMQACLEWSWNLLERQYHDAFASLSMFVDSFDAETIAGGCAVSDAEGLLQRLDDAALVKRFERQGASRYTMLHTVRLFVRQKFDALADRGQRVRAFVSWYERLISRNCNFNEQSERVVLDREWRNAAGAAALAEDAKLWSAVVSLSQHQCDFLLARGEHAAGEALLNRDIRAAAALHNRGFKARALGVLGLIRRTRGDLDGAEWMHRKALAIHENTGRRDGMACEYGNLGLVLRTRGDLDGAEEMFRKALAMNEKLGRLEGMAIQYGNLGLVMQSRGRFGDAEEAYRKALLIDEKLERVIGVAIHYGNLGNVLVSRGDLDGGEAMLLKALAMNEKLGRLEGMAIQYGSLGNILVGRGDLDGAEAMFLKALAINEKLGSHDGTAKDYGNLGNVLRARGDLCGAQEMWMRSREIFGKLRARRMVDQVQASLDTLT